MLSLTGALRAAARRQTDIIRDSAEKPQSLRDEVAAEDDGIIDSPSVPTTMSRGSPILRGFHAHQFVQPKHFSRGEYNKQRSYLKRPTLGPDAPASRYLDTLHQLGIDPLKESLNSSLLSRFVTTMGKIRKRSETNLTWRNQRRVGKAIRRAKMMGIIPVLSKRHLHDSSEV